MIPVWIAEEILIKEAVREAVGSQVVFLCRLFCGVLDRIYSDEYSAALIFTTTTIAIKLIIVTLT